jgi:hypothetical protein
MIDHWNRCQRLYYYNHDLGLQPRELSYPIQRGRDGHAIFEAYYRARINGQDHAEAMSTTEGEISWRVNVLGQDRKSMVEAAGLVRYYWATTAEDGAKWEFIAAEHEKKIDFGNWTYVSTVDLLARERKTDELVIWDHRFLWEPYSKKMVAREPQLPRYALANRPITRARRNMVSTKPLAQIAKANHGRVKRVDVAFTQRRLEIVNAEMQRTAQQILAWRQLPIESRGQLATRSVVPGDKLGSCEQCPMQKLCDAEAWGEDTSALLELEYVASDYYVSGV